MTILGDTLPYGAIEILKAVAADAGLRLRRIAPSGLPILRPPANALPPGTE
jgi:hypothetical protein